jgi:hypothetical protein
MNKHHRKGTTDAVQWRAFPEPWIIAPNGDALPVRMGNTLAAIYRGKHNSDGGSETGPIVVHDFWMDAEDDTQGKRIVLWGGNTLTAMLAEVTIGERVHLRYLGSYLSEFGPAVYRWQLWREINNEAP